MHPKDESLSATIAHGQQLLMSAGIENPRRESRLLLAHALGLPALGPVGCGTVDQAVRERFDAMLRRRMAHEPFAYITGSQGFWTLDLAVSPDTLIPRADSETVIEALLTLRPERGRALRLLDLGTGTGCLLLAALSEFPCAVGLGIDRSEAACRMAAANAVRNGLAGRAMMLCGEWLEAVRLGEADRFDVVISNPPYIPVQDIAGLMPEVSGHEPRLALDGGPDGLRSYRIILAALREALAPGGLALLEIGQGQDMAVSALAGASGLRLASLRADLGGVVRVVCLEAA
ncbi:peptide chain release factor N(5)-glutamine methyltransferase [Lichenicoccus roseus]|uniref:Release factor glutamine methyltransferase n=1 Tax=Lichenicoccus roseus TaxID=2683649 RepID=A0A5R9JAY3_9PROT|nr:peptide chain release factor N(5)-glutamine methyltransferase [Lichenicoccus roseus]TLU72771.1 peptide chain release factor N(5)-glutamine methyltransferase [Lichenicoccus roseus]